jgi:hypothetical protein
VTVAEHPRPQLRGRWLPGNLIDRRGAALVQPILLAVGLDIAAVTGLADIAGFHAVYGSLTKIQWPWLCAVVTSLATSAVGYYLAYRGIYAAEGGYEPSRRQLTALVAAGFSGFFSTGGIRPDGLVLQASGASRREALVRVTTLTGMEQGILALYGCAASIAWLCLGLAGVPMDDFTLPWAVIPVPAFAAAFWLASRYRARLTERAGWRARLSVFLDAVLLIRALFTRPVRHRGAVGGMALFLGRRRGGRLVGPGRVRLGDERRRAHRGLLHRDGVHPPDSPAGRVGNADADPAADDLGQWRATGHRHHRRRRLPPALLLAADAVRPGKPAGAPARQPGGLG